MIVSGTLARNRRAALLLATVGLWACAPPVQAHETMRVLTEEYPPFNFTDNGKITGLATEVVQAVLKEINIEGQFQSVPWARAYDTAQASENVLIYSINRSKEREKLFKWVGQIHPTNFYLFALKDHHIHLTRLEDAKRLQTGTVNQDIGQQYLAAQGFSVGHNLQSSATYELNYIKLKLGRIDLWVMNEQGAYFIASKAGDDPAVVLSKALRIADLSGDGNYMAFGPKTSDAMVERFRKGLETIKNNGIYDALQKKWL